MAGITFATGLHEPREQLFALAYLRAEDTAVDVGANVGIFSAMMAACGAEVIAFEPGSRSRSDLFRTIEANPTAKIRVVPAALSDLPGTLNLTLDLESSNHLLDEVESSGNSEAVEVMTLDGYLEQRELGSITFLKVDAEGFDLEVLRGGERLLVEQKPTIMVETWGSADVREWLEARHYRVYRYAYESKTLHEYPKPFSQAANMLAVHDDQLAFVEARLAGARPAPTELPRIVRTAKSGVRSR